ncbi:MAG: CIA30 family protein [Fuerstiella sp.]|jgi:monofunctional biosynthetic peptidoglycan transglycosylase|nr:CIA30 family protein [Fuerstiella sp.]MCP4506045.1 CIA30 family protein [Fuerstiella sp.]MDG2130190.1 CIA30 family protein [Fuerstiella sp.]
MLRTTLLLPALIAVNAIADTTTADRRLFSFNSPESARQWQTVNDGVMGGRSDGRFRINQFKNLEFYGTLSLANNGGFASMRSRSTSLQLRNGDSISIKVRGDGREYTLNLYTPARRMAFSYRATFQTKKNEWIEVTVPLSKFVATSFGRVVSNSPLNPGQVSGIGVLLGDKKPGPFKLEIDSISVTQANR